MLRREALEKAYEMDMDSRQNATNLEAWLYGLYNQHAIASVLAKNTKYPQKPFELFGGKQKKTAVEEGRDFEKYVQQFNAMRKNKPITH